MSNNKLPQEVSKILVRSIALSSSGLAFFREEGFKILFLRSLLGNCPFPGNHRVNAATTTSSSHTTIPLLFSAVWVLSSGPLCRGSICAWPLQKGYARFAWVRSFVALFILNFLFPNKNSLNVLD